MGNFKHAPATATPSQQPRTLVEDDTRSGQAAQQQSAELLRATNPHNVLVGGLVQMSNLADRRQELLAIRAEDEAHIRRLLTNEVRRVSAIPEPSDTDHIRLNSAQALLDGVLEVVIPATYHNDQVIEGRGLALAGPSGRPIGWNGSTHGVYFVKSDLIQVRGTQAFFTQGGLRKAQDADLLENLVHELQHRMDRHQYNGDNVGVANSLIRFKTEVRANVTAGGKGDTFFLSTGGGSAPSPAKLGLDIKNSVHRAAIKVLQYASKEDRSLRLLDIFIADSAFRADCLSFLADVGNQSLNLTNSPRVDVLHQFISTHWNGVRTVFDRTPPWAALAQRVMALTETEQLEIPQNAAWSKFAEARFVDEEVNRFWMLFS